MASQPPLHVVARGPVRHLVLARPHVHNALNPELIAALHGAVTEAATDHATRAVVISGSGSSFCAGADVEWLRRVEGQSQEQLLAEGRQLHDLLAAIATCPKPVVVRVHGVALGGGMGLVAAADVTVAGRRATFGFTEARIGVVPAVIAPFVLRKTSLGQAQALFLAARRFDAVRAADLGLVQEVVDDGALDEAVERWLQDLLAGGPTAQATIKSLLRRLAPVDFEAAATATVPTLAAVRASAEAQAGLDAFLAKRPPPWTAVVSEGSSSGDGPPDA
jgi:methylglutaconyl-CoA hydratase